MVHSTSTRPAQPRPSTDTEERHLLADTASAATSIFDDGDMTPRATSPVRASSTHSRPNANPPQMPYRGFPSEQAYLDALRAWADSKRFETVTDSPLVGYYGTTTMEEYASRPAAFQGLGLRKKWKARKASKAMERSVAPDKGRMTAA